MVILAVLGVIYLVGMVAIMGRDNPNREPML